MRTYNMNIKLPFLKVNLKGASLGFVISFMLFNALCAIGWFMNFQNISQYWPLNGTPGTEFIFSIVGIVIAPIGTFMGWFF